MNIWRTKETKIVTVTVDLTQEEVKRLQIEKNQLDLTQTPNVENLLKEILKHSTV